MRTFLYFFSRALASGSPPPDGGASRALREEYVLAMVFVFDSGRLGIALAGRHFFCAGPAVHPVADHDGQEARVVQCIVAQPLSRGFITEQQMRRVAVAVTRYWVLKTKLLVDQRDVFLLAGKKQPAGAGVIGIGIFLHGCRSVALRINADGIKKD